ncbi:hypothetical protein [Sphingomonas panacisoli]|nr:hypothetical protein [Sphingomonas panacisoli]
MLVALAVAFAQPMPIAQYRCNAPTYASWTTKFGPRPETVVPGSLIYSVKPKRRADAIAMLTRKSAVALDITQAKAMAGFLATVENLGQPPAVYTPFGRDPNDRVERKPYLVRAVFPGKAPSIAVGWNKDTLIVSAETLGCQPFFNEPLIMWLDREPAAVAVNAGAAL